MMSMKCVQKILEAGDFMDFSREDAVSSLLK